MGRWIGAWLLAVVVVVVAAYAIQYYTADVRGRIEANEQIKSGSSRIVNYEHFFNLCAAVQGHEAGISAAQTALAAATTDREKERLNATVAGLTTIRRQSIAQYNADALKDYTQGQFRDSDLPYQLSAETEETTCAVR